MKLVWSISECGWICDECGAIYGEEEVARMFDYNDQTARNFNDGYCMDCGIHFEEAVK